MVDDTIDARTIANEILQKMKLIASIHENVFLNVK
jgi:hypothetical protein